MSSNKKNNKKIKNLPLSSVTTIPSSLKKERERMNEKIETNRR